MIMLNLYITRHWETEENKLWIIQGQTDGTLSLEWIDQAEKLWIRLKDFNFDYVYCSPLWRTRDTLNKIQENSDLWNIEFSSLIQERHMWDLAWTSWNDIDWDNPWIESDADLISRAWEFIGLVRARHDSWNILIISHWGFIKWIYCYLYKKTFLETKWLYRSGNCSLSLIELSENDFKEIFTNDMRHI